MSNNTPSGQPTPMVAGEFLSESQPSITRFITDKVPAPTELYVTGDAFLRVQCQNMFVATVLTVQTRLLRSGDGAIITGQSQFTPTTDGVLNSFNVSLTEGFLLSVVITAPAIGALRRGLCFVSAQLCLGNASDTRVQQILVQDYLVGNYSVGFPGGLIRGALEGPGALVITSAATPAAGQNLSFAMPANTRSRLTSIRATLVTSAAVANREVRLQLGPNGAPFAEIASPQVQPASTTTNYTWFAAADSSSATVNDNVAPLPENYYMDSLQSIVTSVQNIDAGDQFTVFKIFTEQWIVG